MEKMLKLEKKTKNATESRIKYEKIEVTLEGNKGEMERKIKKKKRQRNEDRRSESKEDRLKKNTQNKYKNEQNIEALRGEGKKRKINEGMREKGRVDMRKRTKISNKKKQKETLENLQNCFTPEEIDSEENTLPITSSAFERKEKRNTKRVKRKERRDEEMDTREIIERTEDREWKKSKRKSESGDKKYRDSNVDRTIEETGIKKKKKKNKNPKEINKDPNTESSIEEIETKKKRETITNPREINTNSKRWRNKNKKTLESNRENKGTKSNTDLNTVEKEANKTEKAANNPNETLTNANTKIAQWPKHSSKSKLPDSVSRLAYNGMLGWETDTSIDDLDFSDDMYHRPNVRRRLMKARREKKVSNDEEGAGGCVIYSEGEEIERLTPLRSYSSDGGVAVVEVPWPHRSSPGFTLQQRHIPTLQDAMYHFPPEVGVAPEEVEEVQDVEDYWVMKDKVLDPKGFREEAKKCIDEKMESLLDHFDRLEKGHLKDTHTHLQRPHHFDEPFYPTPAHLKFLDSLNIVVDWPLSELHKHHLTTYTVPYKNKHEWQALGIFADTTRLTLRESKIIARNWFAFQKEYGFYDLRPLVGVRTARLIREGGEGVTVQPYEYLSHHNRVHFLLYLARDLPHRSLIQVYKKILKLLPLLRGRYLMRECQRVTGLMLAKVHYVMEVFGVDTIAAELLVGRSIRSFFNRCFIRHIMLRDVKLRIGPWRPEEDERLLFGLQQVMHIQTFEEAYRLKRVPWMSIFPYVRTRNTTYMRRRLIVLVCRNEEKSDLTTLRREMARFIKLLYSKQIEDFTNVNWENLAREVGATNPIKLIWSFKKLYYNHVPFTHRNTLTDGLRYMHNHLLPIYERVEILPQEGDPDYHQNLHLSTPHAHNAQSDPQSPLIQIQTPRHSNHTEDLQTTRRKTSRSNDLKLDLMDMDFDLEDSDDDEEEEEEDGDSDVNYDDLENLGRAIVKDFKQTRQIK